jgi:CheY-like chemotaxis protein
VLVVRDTGVGLAPEHLGSVFEMFSQVSPALERTQGGLGIGLALARGLVELHGGSIEARSEGLEQGSTFIVRLPLACVPDAPPAADASASAPPPATSARRVLVVDDNRDAADSLSELLRMQGHDVMQANDGPTALQIAESWQPALALLDIGMPGMNGYELAQRLRALPDGDRIVLAAITGWGQQEDKRRAGAAGFDRHLTKPVDAESLAELLASLADR